MNNFSEAYILAYINGDLPADERSACDALMDSSPEFREKVKLIESLCNLSENLEKQKQMDAVKAWARLQRKIAFISLRAKVWDASRTAAAILLPLLLLHQYVIRPVLDTTPPEMLTLVSAPGMVTKAVLPDGSEVWLNAQSELTYPQRFTGKERSVRLSGEAYFKVLADRKNRFNVELPDGIIASAFGTEFNVHAYRGDPDYQITLARGSLEVGTSRSMEKETLAVGQKAVLTPRTGEMNLEPADTYVETAWKDGKMVFRREKLETIVQKLSRKFGVIIRLEGDLLKNYEYTATFTDETLEDILDLLKRSAPITYSISRREQLDNNTFTQKTVTISSK